MQTRSTRPSRLDWVPRTMAIAMAGSVTFLAADADGGGTTLDTLIAVAARLVPTRQHPDWALVIGGPLVAIAGLFWWRAGRVTRREAR